MGYFITDVNYINNFVNIVFNICKKENKTKQYNKKNNESKIKKIKK